MNKLKSCKPPAPGDPVERIYHVCYGNPDNLVVTDVWDSVENFEKFGETLIPILNELGIDAGQPNVQPIYNVIEVPAFA
jgi:hypothetical protein